MSFDLHIPPGTKQLFSDRLKDIPEDRRTSWRFHIVKTGETLDAIATSLHARASDIAATNGISAQDPMGVDDELVVPVAASNGGLDNPLRYTPRRGDTLVTVADRFNVTVEQLRRWNKLTAGTLTPGRAMYVAEPVRLAPSVRTRGRAASRKGRKSAAHTSAKSSARPSSKSSSAHPSRATSKSKSTATQRKAAR